MPPRSEPVPRARGALHWLAGLLVLGVLAALLVAAAMMLWENVDVQRLARSASGVTPAPPPLPLEPRAAAVPRIAFDAALFESEASAAYFPDSTFYPEMLENWERLLDDAGGRVKRVRSAAALAELGPGTLLVAPGAVCLGAEETAALWRHLRRGGSLVVHRATGARDGRCEWAGWETLRTLTGAIDVLELPAGHEPYVVLPAGMPLAAGLAPGTRIELRFEPHIGLLVTGPRAYWSDWALNPAGPAAEPDADAAAHLRWTAAGGRVVWFAFGPQQAATSRDEAHVRTVFRNGIRWAAGIPMAEVAPWPGARRAALLIAQDVEESGFGNAAALADVLEEAGVEGSFYAVSGLAPEYASLGARLSAAGEVGSHTVDHTPVAGLPRDEQRVRLARSVRQLEEWTGRVPLGLRPPEERFDENTLHAWSELGGSYVVAVNNARSAAPGVHAASGGPMVMLPRLLDDDYNVLVQQSVVRNEKLLSAYVEGMRKLRTLGGIAVVSLHSQLAGQPGRVGVIARVIDSARADGDWWIATGREISDWWLARRGIGLELLAADTDAAAGTDTAREAAAAPTTAGTDAASEAATVRGPEWILSISSGAAELPAKAWIEVYVPESDVDLVPYDGDAPLPYARTPWGLRIPAGAANAVDGRASVQLWSGEGPA